MHVIQQSSHMIYLPVESMSRALVSTGVVVDCKLVAFLIARVVTYGIPDGNPLLHAICQSVRSE